MSSELRLTSISLDRQPAMNPLLDDPQRFVGDCRSLVDLLHRRAERLPDQLAYQFLVDGYHEGSRVTDRELHRSAQAVASQLSDSAGRSRISNATGLNKRGFEENIAGRFALGCSRNVPLGMESQRWRSRLVLMSDRKSRLTRLKKLQDKTARLTHQKFREALDSLPADQRHSATFDNGSEFARCHLVEKTHGTVIYSAQPGCPHQRCTNENTKGLLRRIYPKGIDFRTVTPQDVRRVENLLNNRPRRCLGYRTPNEVFFPSQPQTGCN